MYHMRDIQGVLWADWNWIVGCKQVMIEILYVLIQAAFYSSITYAMIGFEWTIVKFFWYFYIMFCSLLAFTNYGMMMVGLTPNGQLAVILASFFYSLFNLFSGFLIPMPVSLTHISSKFFFPAQCIHLLCTHNMFVFPMANAVPFRNQSHAHLSGCDDDAVISTAHSCMVDMVLLDLSIGMDNVWAYGITIWWCLHETDNLRRHCCLWKKIVKREPVGARLLWLQTFIPSCGCRDDRLVASFVCPHFHFFH